MQIPSFWETIKFCCVQADEVESKDLQPYFNELLHSLLNEKSQCFVKLGDDKTLLALSVTRILIDKITGQKSLFIQILYSWKRFEDKEWQEGFNFIKEFAEHEQCKYIYFEPRNPRIWEMAEFLGCQESNRKFIFNIGGV
ncbi:MAG: hypothetical protein Q8K02_03110 [Flavobacterium sp.]|nr:hypothetical protein [Flavobacterium sp.]